MKRIHPASKKFCFISHSNQSYLTDYVNLSPIDSNLDFSFENINLSELRAYDPSIIIIDEYFANKDYSSIIESIKMNFKRAKIYFLSPEYANYNRIIQSINHKNHFYSNFSVDILNHINTPIGTNKNDYLEAI